MLLHTERDQIRRIKGTFAVALKNMLLIFTYGEGQQCAAQFIFLLCRAFQCGSDLEGSSTENEAG